MKNRCSSVFLYTVTFCLGMQISSVTVDIFPPDYRYSAAFFGVFSGLAVAFLMVGVGGFSGLILRYFLSGERAVIGFYSADV